MVSARKLGITSIFPLSYASLKPRHGGPLCRGPLLAQLLI